MRKEPAVVSCGTCHYYSVSYQGEKFTSGKCRAKPPIGWKEWPGVDEYHWCGGWSESNWVERPKEYVSESLGSIHSTTGGKVRKE